MPDFPFSWSSLWSTKLSHNSESTFRTSETNKNKRPIFHSVDPHFEALNSRKIQISCSGLQSLVKNNAWSSTQFILTLKHTTLANVRIHVERAIRRLKGFKILSNVIPGRVRNVDDIVSICAGLCNLQPQLIRNVSEEEVASEIDEDEDNEQRDEDIEWFWEKGAHNSRNHL